MSTKYMTDRLAVVATVDPRLLDADYRVTDYVDMSLFRKVAFIISVGTTDTTVDAALYEATSSAGASAAALSGYSITQLGGSDDLKQTVIEVDADALTAGKKFVACRVTAGNGTSGSFISVVGVAGYSRYKAQDSDLASVAQIVR